MDDEGDVITGRHGQHLSLDAELQLSRWQQGAGVLLSALLFIHTPLTQVGDHLTVPETERHTQTYTHTLKQVLIFIVININISLKCL